MGKRGKYGGNETEYLRIRDSQGQLASRLDTAGSEAQRDVPCCEGGDVLGHTGQLGTRRGRREINFTKDFEGGIDENSEATGPPSLQACRQCSDIVVLSSFYGRISGDSDVVSTKCQDRRERDHIYLLRMLKK
jgi:hypothetical protein